MTLLSFLVIAKKFPIEDARILICGSFYILNNFGNINLFEVTGTDHFIYISISSSYNIYPSIVGEFPTVQQSWYLTAKITNISASYCFHSKCILRIFQISHKNIVAPPEPGVHPQAYIGPINQGFLSTSSNVCEFNISKMKITPARFTSYDKTAHTLNIRWSTENFFHNRQLGSSIRPLTHLGLALFDWSPPGTTKQVYRN